MANRAISPRFDTEIFGEGASMLERLANQAGPDAIVLDWQLPGMSGIEVCRFLRGTYDEIALPIVMLTVHGHKQDIVEGLAAGANDYLTKPYDPAELLARVGTLVRTRRLHERAKRAERALSVERDRLLESEQRFRMLAEAIPQIVWTADAEGQVDYVNQRWFDSTGMTFDDALGAGWLSAMHPDDREVCEERWRASVASGEVFDLQFRLRRADDNEHHWFLGRAVPLRDPPGRITKWFGTSTDIHAQKRATSALELLGRASVALISSLDSKAAAESLTHLAVPAIADWCGVCLRDGNDSTRLAADAHEGPVNADLLRGVAMNAPAFSRDSDASTPVLRTSQSELVADVAEACQGAQGDEKARLEGLRDAGVTSWMTAPLAVQNRVFGWLAFAVAGSSRRFDEADRAVAEELGRRTAVAIDNARLFEMTQRERARVEEANHAKDEFLATVSHELRTPLNAILGWTVMLRSGGMTEEKRARAIDTIERNARSQTQLIEDLLDISRIVSGKLRLNLSPLDPLRVVETAMDTVRPAAEAKGVRLKLTRDVSTGPILGDSERLQQVIWNLLSNAVKFTPKGGQVEVLLGRAGSDVEIAVTDTGKGMLPQFLPYVFERFRQADMGIARSYGGLGLGLAITRHLVELHGGSIEATSPGEGLGSTFVFRIPLANSRSATGETTNRPPAMADNALPCPTELRGLRVLIVEDEQDARDLMASILEGCGALVTAATTAAEAIELIRQEPPDIMVSDVGMPGESGYDLIRKVRLLPPDHGGRTPAVALTAYARMEDRTRALMMGFDMHVPKPIEPSELLVVIAHLASRFVKG
jgi:PAS domain S-box-containing protein